MIVALILLLFLASPALATDRYASPSGSGDCTTALKPCASATILSAGQPGDTLYYAAGTYTTQLHTVRAGTAASPIKIRPTVPGTYPKFEPTSTPTQGRNLRITHSYIDVAGLEFSCSDAICTDNQARIQGSGSYPNETLLQGVKVRDVKVTGQNGSMYIGSTNGTVIAYTYSTQSIAGSEKMEPFYLGSSSGTQSNTGLVIYGATMYRMQGECVDFKQRTAGSDVHHIYCENPGWWTDPPGVSAGGTGNTGVMGFGMLAGNVNVVRRAIIKGHRVSNSWGCAGFYSGSASGTGRFEDSVCRDALNGGIISGSTSGHRGYVTRNTFCGMLTYTGYNVQNVVFTDNNGYPGPGADSSECDTVEAAIIAEIAARPALATAEVGLIAANKVRIDLNNASLAAADGKEIYGYSSLVKSIDHSSCTITGATPSNPTVTASAVVAGSTNLIELTLSGSIDNNDVPLLTCGAGFITNTGQIGGAWISDLATSSSFSNFAITNNVDAVADTSVLTQVAYRFKRENNQIDTGVPISVAPGAIILTELQINCTIANCPAIGMKMQYTLNGGASTDVPDTFGADNIRFVGGTFTGFVPAEGTPIPTCLVATSGSDIPGAIQRRSNAVPTVDLGLNDCTTNGYAVMLDTDAVISSVYSFCPINQTGDALTGGCSSPAVVTVVEFGGVVATDRTQATGRTAATGRTQATGRLQVVQ